MDRFTFYTTENTECEPRELLEGISSAYDFLPNLFAYMAEAPKPIEAYLSLNALSEWHGCSMIIYNGLATYRLSGRQCRKWLPFLFHSPSHIRQDESIETANSGCTSYRR